ALVPLLAPRVTVVVIAGGLPEARLVLVQQLDPADPLRRLPEVEMWHQEAGWSTVLGRQVDAVVPVGDPCLAVEQVLERQVRGVAAVRMREREVGRRVNVTHQG